MRRRIVLALAPALLGLLAASATGHFNMLLPQSASVKVKEVVPIVYQWGHPFEHQLFDAPAPESVLVFSPAGKKTDLTNQLKEEKIGIDDKKETLIRRFRFTPEERGDYIFILNTKPIWMAEDDEFLQDSVKVVLHVQAQKGWDQIAGQPFEMVPLTRPYGLQPGMVFQAQALADGKPLAAALVEIERYNATAPRELPPDEQRTRVARTDPNGVVTCTLTEPGWWCLTAQREAGKRDREGKTFPVWQRASFWVYVDEKITPKNDK
jgi:cobalt/nickel transport protein